jgi:Domain of unknown function (DUF4124)
MAHAEDAPMFRPIMIRLLPLALPMACAWSTPQVFAQAIHTCIDASGMKSYQNVPCAPNQRTALVRSYETKPEDPAIAARMAAIQQEMDRRNRPSGRPVAIRSGHVRRTSGPTPCQAAKAKRKATLDRVGLKRNFDLLSRLDSEVWEVCKGF